MSIAKRIKLFLVVPHVLLFLPFTSCAAMAADDHQQQTKSPAVVAIQGVVLSAKSRWVKRSELVVTDVTLRIAQTSDPQLSGTLIFTSPGGELIERNLRMTVNAIPMFRAGQNITVSLDRPLANSGNRYRYRTHLPQNKRPANIQNQVKKTKKS